MRKRNLDGRPVWVVKDSEYLKYVEQARDDYFESEEPNQPCYGCVDRHDDAKECPTFKSLGLKRTADGVCNHRVLDEVGLVEFMAKRMGA